VKILVTVTIDKYGRVLIPKEVRKKLELSPNTTLDLIVRGDEIVLRVRDLNLEKKIKELSKYLAYEEPEAFINKSCESDSKWFSKRYCFKK